MTSLPRIAILISGRGSNMQAIIDGVKDGRIRATIALVLSNRADAAGLARAQAAGLDTLVLSHRDYTTRAAYDTALARELLTRDVSLVCLAGFMRLLGPDFVSAFPNRVLNIHPSLLPAFPGLDAQRQAWEHGAKVSGVTVHFVTADLDAGPIVAQTAVSVRDADTAEALAGRILIEEHRLYPQAIQFVLDGRWRIDGRRVLPA